MQYVVIVTKKGKIKRFYLENIRPMGREAKGIRGITLDDGDEVASMQIVNVEKE